MTGAWALESTIGSGSVGEVWRARHTADGRIGALKRLRPDAIDRQRTSLTDEAAALLHLSHPNLPTLLDADLNTEPPYLVMSLAEGEPLNALIASGALWLYPLADRLSALAALAGAVDSIHALGWLHRDIKPANVRGLAHPMLLDFGLACPFDGCDHPDEGTAAYLPPLGESPSPASDRYAFAVTAYEVLFGAHPTLTHTDSGQSPAKLRRLSADRLASDAWRRPSRLAPHALPGDLRGGDLGALEACFAAGLAPDPAQRPPNLTGWVAQLAAICAPLVSQPPLDGSPFRPPPAFPGYTDLEAAGLGDTDHPPRRGWWSALRALFERS
ncbi:MAG: serine/threonine protein kinase [Anaerolineae bacterium]|jgi:serine/threonine protein kinase|nr:serine/threonine protein kinase [Anaerolineae bacterium]